ncbi:MAG: hypothetical protein IIC51_07940 [Planctomycetes bacterium]|nr:hypothetical protein [Planctomycetota bacterium]MCH9034177.1 hypothetical protein [Planctomycetota bacterium]
MSYSDARSDPHNPHKVPSITLAPALADWRIRNLFDRPLFTTLQAMIRRPLPHRGCRVEGFSTND